MKLQIRSRDVEVTEELRGHVERRVGFALGRFGMHIGLVIVRLSRGGVTLDGSATCCRIDVALRPRHVDTEDVDTDLLTAVDHAAHRVSRTVARILDLDPKR